MFHVAWSARWAVVHCLLVCVVLLGGCASVPHSDEAGLPRLDVVPGQTLLIPMDESWAADVGERPTGWLDTGASVRGVVYRINLRLLSDPTLDRAARWLPPPGVWTSGPVEPVTGNEQQGSWRLLGVDLPWLMGGDAGDGRPRVLRILGKDFSIHYLPRDSELARLFVHDAAPGTSTGEPWTPTVGSAGAVSPILTALAWPEAMSPLGRWRYRLMTGTLRPALDPPPFDIVAALSGRTGPEGLSSGDLGRGAIGGLQPFEDPVVEALARQYEARWRAAISNLWKADADVALRVKRRLAGVVDFGNGYVAPAWSTGVGEAETLLADLLDPEMDDAQRVWRAESWLQMQPTALAWVVDDSGTLDASSGGGIGSISVANLTDVPTLAWTSNADVETGSLMPLPARAVARLAVNPLADGGNGAGATDAAPTRTIRAHAGRWHQDLTVIEGRVPATPPGLRLGPLLPDYTMETWLKKTPTAAPNEWRTAAMLYKVDGRWELMVECLTPKGLEDPAQDLVRVWLGPLGTPLSVLRVDGRGQIADEARRADLVKTPTDVRVVRSEDRWSFRMTIPAGCIERDGVLRLGMTRSSPGGPRAALPRPMLPWQDEPGRVAIDATRWD